MKNRIFSKALITAAAIAVTATGFSVSTNAQDRIIKSVEVSYLDLDLTSVEGKATLQGRLKGAVRKVCGSYNIRDLRDTRDHVHCVKEANLSAQRATVTIMAAVEAGTPIETALLIGN